MEGKAKDWRPALSIAILNYHEVTRDARVFKQARALAEAGHQVTVFCNQAEGMAAQETVHGIHIKRFRCFERNNIDGAVLTELRFLKRSWHDACRKYKNFLATEEAAKLAAHFVNSSRSSLGIERSYYKKFAGIRRVLRKLEYRYFRLRHRQFVEQIGVAPISPSLSAVSNYMREQRAAVWRSLEGLRSLILLDNLLKTYGTEPFDIVHAHDLLTLPAGVVMAKAQKARLIYDAHEYEPERVSLSPQERDFTERFERDCLDQADAIVTVSKGIARLYAERFHGEEPTLIYNSPDTGRSDVAKGTKRLRERLGLAVGVPLIVFIGAIQRANRGVDKIVGALVHLPEYHLVNLGPRHATNDAWLRQIATDLGVEERLHYLDPVPAQDVPFVVSDASAAASASQNLCLSYLHSMPNKLFEATFAGIPVCVPDRPDQKEFVDLVGHGIATDQTDPLAIAAALRELVENPERFRITDRAKQLLDKEYSWQAQVEKLLALYDELGAKVAA